MCSDSTTQNQVIKQTRSHRSSETLPKQKRRKSRSKNRKSKSQHDQPSKSKRKPIKMHRMRKPQAPRWATNAIPDKCLPIIRRRPEAVERDVGSNTRRNSTHKRDPSAVDSKCSRCTRYNADVPSNPLHLAQLYVEERKTSSKLGHVRTRTIQKSNGHRIASDVSKVMSDMLATEEKYSIIWDLQKRIASIPIKNRPLPESINPDDLGLELKIRLATRAPLLDVAIDTTDHRNHVTARKVTQRHIPMYDINEEGDPSMTCLMKITTKHTHSS